MHFRQALHGVVVLAWPWHLQIRRRYAPIVIAAVPFFKDDYFEFKDHIDKRGVKSAREGNFIEDSYWDPISKIDVIDQLIN